jgi:hypothetical protein
VGENLMSRSKILAIFGTSAMFLGALTMGGCPSGGSESEVADESTNSTAEPGDEVTAQDPAPIDDVVTDTPDDDTPPPLDDITDPGNNESGVVGDFDNDGVLTDADILILGGSFGSSLPGGDLNDDNKIDILDLALLLSLVR